MTFKYCFILLLLTLCSNFAFSQREMLVSIHLPKNSGWAFTDYLIYEVSDDCLSVIERSIGLSLDTSNDEGNASIAEHYDTLAQYSISSELQLEMANVLAETDSLGHHTTYCVFSLDWPRFFIYANYKGKEMDGLVAHCYREHIYKIVDVFNKIYPEDDVLSYNKEELLIQEAKCNEKI